ncbi:MAG TPA: hypothetical protein VL651_03435 [Bacteroidia bacterium]|jgi:antitoxin component YwqK of YwqJK toxin-antitoxin module|nr:hypothetical protein [Bacteroidia bacterium]
MRSFFLLLCSIIIIPAYAQFGKQKNTTRYYEFKDIYDSTLGIDIYERLNFYFDADSVRYTDKGYAAQNTWEDYYKSGAVLHTGYYVDGTLRSYKNYYENGQIERDFHQVDFTSNQMILYWPNGKVRSDITYYQGTEMITHEYYEDGSPDYAEEYAKKCEYLLYRTSWFENKNMESDMQLLDKKKQKYYLKEYYENGNLMDEGVMQYYTEIDNFMKEGEWKVYDETTGKQVSVQTYVRNQMTDERKL